MINYEIINNIDNFLSFGFTTSAIGIVLSMMSTVYFALFAYKLNYLNDVLAFTLAYHLQQLTQLILNCFINGQVHEQTIGFLSDLDNININVNDDQLFKALILLRTSISTNKRGFTIGGFAQWNNLTLLQVT